MYFVCIKYVSLVYRNLKTNKMKTFSNFFGIIAILLLATGLVGIFTGEALNLIIASLATGSVAVFIFIYTSNIKSIQ